MPVGVPEWIACSFVEWAARDRISLLPKLEIHHPPLRCLYEGYLEGKLAVTRLYSVHPYWWKRQV